MTDILRKLLLAGLFVASVSYANSYDYRFESKSLVGFEGSYSSIDVEDATNVTTKENPLSMGLKIGAQTHDVRLFLSFRNINAADFNTAYMYGAELQYLFNFSEKMNFFVGGNTGRLSINYDDAASTEHKFTTKYIGGDIGLNLHLSENVDFELGTRIITLSESQDTSSSYKFSDMTTNYISLIIRYEMD